MSLMNTEIIKQYINEYDFLKAIDENRQKYMASGVLDKYIKENGEDHLYNFSKDFWTNPTQSVKKLKEKYKINNNIGYKDIIKNFPDEKYIDFLNYYYKNNYSLEELSDKFIIAYDKAKELIIEVKLEGEFYCPNCLNNIFDINIINNEFEFKCNKCKEISTELDLFDREKADEILEKKKKEKEDFINKLYDIDRQLKNIKCPKCNNELILKYHDEKLIYILVCESCGYSSKDFEKVKADYKVSKQKAAMMIKIREKEDERLKELLKNKLNKDIVIKNEDLIQLKDCQDAFDYIFQKNLDIDEMWRYYFSRIRKLKRLERKVLINLLFEAKKVGNLVNPLDNKNINDVYLYKPEEPIISELIRITNIVVVRKTLRKIISDKFIVLDEGLNGAYIPQVLIDNIDRIKKFLDVQNIDSQIRYLIFQRQNFSCYLCGETGRPLKIAYTDALKNNNDLGSMIGVCEDCYDNLTENEVLVDIEIANDINENLLDESKVWRFLLEYLPEVKESEEVYNKVVEWNKNYKEEDIIKALAVTINKMNKVQEFTIGAFISYNTSVLNNGEILIWDKLDEKFELDKWI